MSHNAAFHQGLPIHCLLRHKTTYKGQEEGQMALNRTPKFSLKLTYRYLLKADHIPGDTWDGAKKR